MTGGPPISHEPVELRSSRTGLMVGLAGGLVPTAIGLLALAAGGLSPIALGLLAIGAFIVGANLFDYPLRTVLAESGVTRYCPLRRRQLGWSDLDVLTRGPSPLLSLAQGDARPPGGLVFTRGRLRHQIATRSETHEQFTAVTTALEAWNTGVLVAAGPP